MPAGSDYQKAPTWHEPKIGTEMAERERNEWIA
jgi:hypothetical protein